MSERIRRRANEHKVKHLFSGKKHFFEVESVSGEKYNVSIKINCDCQYMGVQGVPNGKMCSHILATFKEIIKKSEINQKEEMNQTEMQIETNRRKYLTPGTISLLRPKNAIFISAANKLNHEISKLIGGYSLRKVGDIPQFSLKLINLLNEVETEFNKLIKDFPKEKEDFVTETVPVNNPNRQIDLVKLRDEQHYEWENDHTIKKAGAFTFYI